MSTYKESLNTQIPNNFTNTNLGSADLNKTPIHNV